ncbi:MAG: hypothetical protein WAU47_08625, partial [Desulfobaccales bacterium]
YSTKPFWVAVGAHFLVSDRLTIRKLAGLIVALGGVYLAFLGPSISAPAPDAGNLMEIVAALFFSATALYTKWLSSREHFNSYQTLFPMMLFSMPCWRSLPCSLREASRLSSISWTFWPSATRV